MLKILTSIPISDNPIANLEKITTFWDRTTPIWQKIWGQHIHHGYFEANETPEFAQEKLIVKITELLDLSPGKKLLDVGCGMGGSSIYLTKNFQVKVSGVSLSKTQITIATQKAQQQAIAVDFIIEDAHSLKSFADNSFDIIWSLESCEQFYDKNLFIQQARRLLKPNGQLMIATWCAAHEEFTNKLAKKYRKICQAFDTPYMPTFQHYLQLLQSNHFSLQYHCDWSDYVKSSWQRGVISLYKYPKLKLLRYCGFREILFLQRIKLIREFFEKGWLKYGVFVASKS